MRTATRLIIALVIVIAMFYFVLILNGQLERIIVSLDALYELLSNSRIIKI